MCLPPLSCCGPPSQLSLILFDTLSSSPIAERQQHWQAHEALRHVQSCGRSCCLGLPRAVFLVSGFEKEEKKVMLDAFQEDTVARGLEARVRQADVQDRLENFTPTVLAGKTQDSCDRSSDALYWGCTRLQKAGGTEKATRTHFVLLWWIRYYKKQAKIRKKILRKTLHYMICLLVSVLRL